MSLSECRLSLKVERQNNIWVLTFGQPLGVITGHLCTVEKSSNESLKDSSFTDIPDMFSRTLFRLIHGIRIFSPIFCIRSDTRKSATGNAAALARGEIALSVVHVEPLPAPC